MNRNNLQRMTGQGKAACAETSGSARRLLRARALASVAVGLMWGLLNPATSSAQPEWTQSFDLVPGWNAIYLHVQPENTDPAVVFAGISVRSVWTRGVEPGSVEFIADPADAMREQRGWLAYVPANLPESVAPALADKELVSIEGNRAFLVQIDGDPVTLNITGLPLVPAIDWQANEFNLVGFPIDPNDPPTFSFYFAGSSAHQAQPVYRLLASGQWERVAAPNADKMRYGEAYYVFSGSASDFVAPLAVQVPSSDGFSYGAGVADILVAFQNLSDIGVTVEIGDLASPDAVPLSYLDIVTEEGPDLGEFQWPPLEGGLAISANTNDVKSARLAVRRGDFSADSLSTVLSISDGAGTRWLLPLQASRAGGASAAALAGTGDSAFTGLWIGQATVNRVSQPQIASLTALPTNGSKNVCTGGPNEGLACSGPTDCPGECSLTCLGGSNAGDSCTVANEATDCPGSSCSPQPRRCLGGINIGLECSDEEFCVGSTCGAVGACVGGPREGLACTEASESDGCSETFTCAGGTNEGMTCTVENEATDCPGSTCRNPSPLCLDCPQSTCNEGSRCIGGINDGDSCSGAAQCSFLCDQDGGGSEFAMRLLIHVDSVGQVRLLKQVIQMWEDGTTRPDPGDPEFEVDDTPGRFVLLTDDTLIDDFAGSTLRDGRQVGRRISSAHYDYPGNDLEMTGDFGGTSTLSATIELSPNFPTNPYRHKFHPDHDNLGQQSVPVEEAFAITRDIELVFSDTDPTGLNSPDYGFSTVAGSYSEEIAGLHRNTIRVEGTFRLQRAMLIAELNK